MFLLYLSSPPPFVQHTTPVAPSTPTTLDDAAESGARSICLSLVAVWCAVLVVVLQEVATWVAGAVVAVIAFLRTNLDEVANPWLTAPLLEQVQEKYKVETFH